VDSANDLAAGVFLPLHPGCPMEVPALVIAPFRYQDNLTVGRLHGFLGRESDCVIVRS